VLAERLRPRGQSEHAYEYLRDAITRGRYTPNQRLVEADLVETLGVSRVTVRGALLRLEQDGLVEIRPNRGARVRSFTPQEALRVLQVREVVEGLAAALAAERMRPDSLAELGAILRKMESAIRDGDLLLYSTLNGQFHRLILDVANHEVVEQVLGTLRHPLIRYQFRTVLVPGRAEQSLGEHRRILQALERGDARSAERAAREHVAHVRTALERSAASGIAVDGPDSMLETDLAAHDLSR
jgi:DNA-binding GntR family transcriptional regulator